MKRILILGSTGSIGRNVCEVVRLHRRHFDVVGLAAGSSDGLMREQLQEFSEACFVLTDTAAHGRLIEKDPALSARAAGVGEAAFADLIERTMPDLVVNALVGFVGLAPTLAALDAGIPVAVANKESIVSGCQLLIKKAADDISPGTVKLKGFKVKTSGSKVMML